MFGKPFGAGTGAKKKAAGPRLWRDPAATKGSLGDRRLRTYVHYPKYYEKKVVDQQSEGHANLRKTMGVDQ